VGESLIGCSGWSYRDWQGRFYPHGLRSHDHLAYYSKRFNTVEVNMTFYRFPTAKAVLGWREATPDGFMFAVKMNRVITHYRRLRNVGRYVASFMGSIAPLGDKLGPVLIQLPPDLSPDHDLLERFLDLLPRDGAYAIEFRDRSWLTSRTYGILDENDVATVLTDPPGPPSDVRMTSDLCYVRWHGRGSPSYRYTRAELEGWADFLQELPVGRVFGYFNNDVGAAAPHNARTLQDLLPEPRKVEQRSLLGR
jgi:uncharacterized protein YecE (DUF72 family)